MANSVTTNGTIPPNYDSWLPMPEVKTKTGMSQRTIYRMVQEGKLRQASRPIPGRRPLPVFHPGDVATFEEQQVKGSYEINPEPVPAPKEWTAADALSRRVSELVELTKLLRTNPSEGTTQQAPPARLFLTLQEAVEYSGLPAGTLLEFLHSGRLPAIDVGRRRRGGRWRIRQVDLRKLSPIPLETHYEVLAQSQQV